MRGTRVDGTVIVTGAARGQGAAEARLLAGQGVAVVLTDVLDAVGEDLADELGDQVIYAHLDVTSEADWARTVELAERTFGPVRALVNNAGVSHRVGLMEIDLGDWNHVLDVNLTGPLLGMRACVPSMRRAGGGSIVNVSSIAGLTAYSASAYSASKWALRGLTKVGALELGPSRIRVNSVHPGLIETPMLGDAPQAMLDAFASLTPLGRGGRAEEVAALVAFLCSDGSSYINGAEIAVDGGFTAAGQMQGVLGAIERTTGGPATLRVPQREE
ncbi:MULTISPECIES: glucose 1-dehydrogenase [unclassified Micromonospora]|uniref:SDR family NAD(P)-dependent oxidoreductase n=1 Tax=unclassified Micromonospora TaxID=2617518 RepID=UPI0033A792FF